MTIFREKESKRKQPCTNAKTVDKRNPAQSLAQFFLMFHSPFLSLSVKVWCNLTAPRSALHHHHLLFYVLTRGRRRLQQSQITLVPMPANFIIGTPPNSLLSPTTVSFCWPFIPSSKKQSANCLTKHITCTNPLPLNVNLSTCFYFPIAFIRTFLVQLRLHCNVNGVFMAEINLSLGKATLLYTLCLSKAEF